MQAQFWAYFNTSQRPCLVDSTQLINQFTDWDFYKTTNDEWDGPLDSTFCGAVNPNGEIDLSTIGTGETFFVRYRFDDNNKAWLSNDRLHAAGFVTFLDSLNYINTGNNCNGNLCSSVMVGVEIPDSAGTGTDMRWYEQVPSSSSVFSDSFSAHFCVPTENFANNYLREIIGKFTIDNPNGEIGFKEFSIEDVWSSYTTWFNINIHQNGNGNYEYHVYDHELLIRSNPAIYPNSYGVEYIDLIPVPNPSTAVTMDIIINPEASFITQPFLELQGEYLSNSTTQRHNYNIINNGGNLCFPNFIEVVLKDGNHYIHKAGNVDFGSRRACMQFGEGSKLIVDDNARLDYGVTGVGNLALRTGSSIEIRKNAELHINNNVMLFEFKYDTEPQQIYMTLNEGSKLSFGKLANITNEYSLDGTMKLNIYMKGGEVDLSQLAPASRALVNLIYETPTASFSDNIKVLGNPIQDNIRFSIVNAEQSSISVYITSSNGQLIYNEIIESQKGYDEIELPALGLANGLYFLTIHSNDNIFTEKVIILK